MIVSKDGPENRQVSFFVQCLTGSGPSPEAAALLMWTCSLHRCRKVWWRKIETQGCRAEIPFHRSFSLIPGESPTEEKRGLMLTFLQGMRALCGWNLEVLSPDSPLCFLQCDSASLPQVLSGLCTHPHWALFLSITLPLLKVLSLLLFAPSIPTHTLEPSSTAPSQEASFS